ncbi:MAG: hypothetical protein ACXVEF_29190 [Polyangiales bacterium]
MRFALGLCLLLGCASGPPRTISKGPAFPSTCLTGFCVVPDHVVARRLVPTERRCVITAWDGPSSVPPTAKVSTADDAPATPGVFISVEIPNLRLATPYTIKSDPMARSAAMVLVVRVTPAVTFADRHFVEEGDVTVIEQGDDLLVVVKAKSSTGEETVTLVLPKSANGCGPIAQ